VRKAFGFRNLVIKDSEGGGKKKWREILSQKFKDLERAATRN